MNSPTRRWPLLVALLATTLQRALQALADAPRGPKTRAPRATTGQAPGAGDTLAALAP